MVKILIIEDDLVLQMVVKVMLSRKNYIVEVASDGRAGLNAISSFLPDLVITDFMMPEISGDGVLDAIRSCPKLQHIPVVLMTALDRTAQIFDAGWDGILLKPFSISSLYEIVDQSISATHKKSNTGRSK